MAQRLTHGDAANLKFRGNGVLAKLFAFPQFATENFVPEALDDGSRKGLPPDGIQFFRGNFLDRCAGVPGLHSRKFTKQISPKQARQK
jgi:hypothetical protein